MAVLKSGVAGVMGTRLKNIQSASHSLEALFPWGQALASLAEPSSRKVANCSFTGRLLEQDVHIGCEVCNRVRALLILSSFISKTFGDIFEGKLVNKNVPKC